MVFAVALVVSNIVAAKTVMTGFTLFGSPVVVPSAVVCYFLTFLMTDVVGELWGRKEAAQIVKWGFVCQVFACILIGVAQLLPAASGEMQGAYELLLGQNVIFVIASLLAYLTSQSWDVLVFHGIRDRFLKSGKGNAWRWVWNNASTMSSQAIDTVIYITIAFGSAWAGSSDVAMVPLLLGMMVGHTRASLSSPPSTRPSSTSSRAKAVRASSLLPKMRKRTELFYASFSSSLHIIREQDE